MKKFLSNIRDSFRYDYYRASCRVCDRSVNSYKDVIEKSLEKHFENSNYHSFTLVHNIFPKITHVNNLELPLDFLRTNIWSPTPENIKREISRSGYEPDVFLMKYNIKEEELVTLYNKFDNKLLCVLGYFTQSEPCILKYENKKLSYIKT